MHLLMERIRRSAAGWVPWATLATVILQLFLLSYSYGRLNQQVEDLSVRLERIERWMDSQLTR